MSELNKPFFEVYQEEGEYEIQAETARHAAIRYVRSKIASQNKEIRTEKQAKENTVQVRLTRKGYDRTYIYEAWFWHEDAPDTHPDWMGDTLTKVGLTKNRPS